MKIHKKSFSGIPINFTFLSYLQNYKEFKAKILDLQPEKYGLLFEIKKCTTSGWALGDENVIGIRAFNFESKWLHDFATLTAHNWQKWKSRLLTCPCHKIYRVEAVGLSISNNTLKITIFVNIWNLGQCNENLIFCQYVLKCSNLKILLHTCDTYNCDYLPHITIRFYYFNFQLNINFSFKFWVFYRKIT